MKKRNKTLTPKQLKQKELREQYNKERRRIQSWENRAKKRGFVFDKTVVPKLLKQVSEKSIEKIKKLRPKELYKKAKYYDIEKDTYVKGEEAKKAQQQELRRQRELEQETYKDRYPHDEDNNIPDYTYINAVEDELMDIPDSRYVEGKPMETGKLRDTMINGLYDTMATYDNPNDYNEYLSTVYGEIQEHSRTIQFASKQFQINASFSTGLSLIVHRDLTWDEATILAEETERMFGY